MNERVGCLPYDDGVGWGAYPMNDAGSVKMFNTAENLIHEVGHTFVIELHLDHLTHVGVHVFHYDVAVKGKGETRV